MLVGLLLGEPIERSPVLPDIAATLRELGVTVPVAVPDARAPLPDWLAEADLLVLRGLAAPVLARLDGYDARCCNSPRAVLAVNDRWWLAQTLRAAGVPTPASRRVTSWAEVLAATGDLVVKALDGARGRGAGVLPARELPSEPPFPGPYLLQAAIEDDGWVHKLYVVGADVRGVRKPRAAGAGADEPFHPDADQVALGRAVAAAVGLEILGADVLTGGQVIDVNAFPSTVSLPGGAGWISDYLMDRARR